MSEISGSDVRVATEYSEEDFRTEVESMKERNLKTARESGDLERLTRFENKSYEEWIASTLNNFHGHLPGGFYRYHGIHEEIVADIDRLVKVLGFDQTQMIENAEKSVELMSGVLDLVRKRVPSDQAEAAGKRAWEHDRQQLPVFVALYIGMRRLGYSHRDLVS